MAEDEPPRKRAKAELRKNPKYWYKTGDVVLVANGREAFKVHSDVLGQRSKVFRDMLSGDLPQPADQETMDGVPLIPLSDDPGDMRIFLDLVYNTWNFHFDDGLPDWPLIRIMVTLGDKYDVPTFRNEGIRRIDLMLSNDIETWDKNIAFKPVPDFRSVAQVTRTLEHEFPDLHAAALYLCCSSPLTTLLEGINGSPSDMALHPEDVCRCLLGRDTLVEGWFDFYEKMAQGDPPPTELCRPGKCGKLKDELRSSLLSLSRSKLDPVNSYDLLGYATDIIEDAIKDKEVRGLCQNCTHFYRQKLLNMRTEHRRGLKDRFQLPELTTGAEATIDAVP